MKDLGLGEHMERGRGNYKESIHRGRSMARKRMKNNDGDAMDVDGDSGSVTRSKSRNRSQSHVRGPSRNQSGVRPAEVYTFSYHKY